MRIKIERSENIFYPQERFHNQTPILNVFKYKFTQKFHKLKKKQFFLISQRHPTSTQPMYVELSWLSFNIRTKNAN